MQPWVHRRSSIPVEMEDSVSNLKHFIQVLSELFEEEKWDNSWIWTDKSFKSLQDGSNLQVMCLSGEWVDRAAAC